MAHEKKPGWKELQKGDVLDGGTAAKFKTGDWRSERPIHIPEKCINCLTCWIYCPDSAIIVKDGKITGYNYDYCKGCGICMHECPVKGKAIKMVPEREAKKNEKICHQKLI